MNIIIIANSHKFYTIRRLCEEIEALGHCAQIIDPDALDSTDKKVLENTIILNRCSGISYNDNDLDTLTKFTNSKISNAIEDTRIFRDKWLQYLFFIKNNLPTINTANLEAGEGPNFTQKYGYLIKPKRSNQTRGIIKSPDLNFKINDKRYIIQPLLKKKNEYRVLIALGTVLGILKKSHDDPFELLNCERSTLSFIPWLDASAKLKELIHKILPYGPDFYGLDILEQESGHHLIIELNNVPGFEYFEKVSHVNVAQKYISGLLSDFNDLSS